MALRGLTNAARRELIRQGRDDLAVKAVGHIGLTFDGATLYVHLFPRQTWRKRMLGEAFVLAHADLIDLPWGLPGIRALLSEARTSLDESGPAMARWLENN